MIRLLDSKAAYVLCFRLDLNYSCLCLVFFTLSIWHIKNETPLVFNEQ